MSEKVIRPTLSELWRGIQDAKRKFPVGTEWEHYSGSVYEITGHGVDEETGQPEVCYVRARPLADGRCSPIHTSLGDSPADYSRDVEFHRLLSKMEGDYREPVSGKLRPRFRRVYRTEIFQSVHGREIASV